MIKLIIFILLIYSITAYQVAICNIVGYQIDEKINKDDNTPKYQPYLEINVYLGEESIMYSPTIQSPLARPNQYSDSCTDSESDVVAWLDSYSIGRNYTCYYDDINNIYMDIFDTSFINKSMFIILGIGLFIIGVLGAIMIFITLNLRYENEGGILIVTEKKIIILLSKFIDPKHILAAVEENNEENNEGNV